MQRTKKRKLTFTIPEKLAKGLAETKERTGIPISKQIEMMLRGHKIIEVGKEK